MSKEEISFEEFKNSVKKHFKIMSRITCFDKYEIFGLVEAVIGCPYSIFDVKCLSNDAVVYQIRKEDFLSQIRGIKKISQTIKQKL